MKRDLRWWCLCFAHNCLIHPLLPFADAADALGAKKLARVVYTAHDYTVPQGGG